MAIAHDLGAAGRRRVAAAGRRSPPAVPGGIPPPLIAEGIPPGPDGVMPSELAPAMPDDVAKSAPPFIVACGPGLPILRERS